MTTPCLSQQADVHLGSCPPYSRERESFSLASQPVSSRPAPGLGAGALNMPPQHPYVGELCPPSPLYSIAPPGSLAPHQREQEPLSLPPAATPREPVPGPSSTTWRNLHHYAPLDAPLPPSTLPSALPPRSSGCFPPAPQEPLSLARAPPGRASFQVPQDAPGNLVPQGLYSHTPYPCAPMSGTSQPCMAAPPPPISPTQLAPSTLEPPLSRSQVLPEERGDGISVTEHSAPHPPSLPWHFANLLLLPFPHAPIVLPWSLPLPRGTASC